MNELRKLRRDKVKVKEWNEKEKIVFYLQCKKKESMNKWKKQT